MMRAAYPIAPPTAADLNFVYHGWQFFLGADPTPSSTFTSRVLWRLQGTEHMALPIPSEPFASEALALLHAEKQAVRWVRDHMGYGQAEV
ncbi:hypothetical protein [Variovorax ginsengisoli]|uniref:Uncharacterized protein n=1 Tax=Variovorax ginsengisoli TaxID=363844 RepID=A0ABT9SAB1_9BURK|nr:hypothetical protein [Variovorax ginsengisoli]MDP9901301.1 hypothetical protein [Variovorax ginsengisoli]